MQVVLLGILLLILKTLNVERGQLCTGQSEDNKVIPLSAYGAFREKPVLLV